MNNNEMLLLKLGEVVLKGQNRRSFEDRLVTNVRRRLKKCGSFQVYVRQSTIYAEPVNGGCDMEAAWRAARQVFGVVSVARAVPCEKTVPAIVDTASRYLAEAFAQAKSFKVESKRADKNYPLNSIQLSQAVGGELAEAFPNVTVDVHNPDLTVHVEIREKHAYVHAPAVPGAGGLPVGMGGHAVSLLSGGLDSPVSSWMMARRGVELEMVHFVSPPYTSQQAQDKVLELARLLTTWCGRMALITGESLGQVASQTMMALAATDDVASMPVLRPLIGMDKVEIIRMAREIGTYETSILPYEDCCTVFTPRHPATRPVLEEVCGAEAALDVEGLVARALEGESWIRVKS